MLEAGTREKTKLLQLNVKLNPDADPQRFVRSVAATQGILNVTQTFPEETDPELKRLFVIDLDPQSKTALQSLRGNHDVEYVEEVRPRKLIR